jgi:hypothetical protein
MSRAWPGHRQTMMMIGPKQCFMHNDLEGNANGASHHFTTARLEKTNRN